MAKPAHHRGRDLGEPATTGFHSHLWPKRDAGAAGGADHVTILNEGESWL